MENNICDYNILENECEASCMNYFGGWTCEEKGNYKNCPIYFEEERLKESSSFLEGKLKKEL